MWSCGSVSDVDERPVAIMVTESCNTTCDTQDNVLCCCYPLALLGLICRFMVTDELHYSFQQIYEK